MHHYVLHIEQRGFPPCSLPQSPLSSPPYPSIYLSLPHHSSLPSHLIILVQCARALVHERKFGPRQQQPRKRQPLLLAQRQHRRPLNLSVQTTGALCQVAQSHVSKHLKETCVRGARLVDETVMVMVVMVVRGGTGRGGG